MPPPGLPFPVRRCDPSDREVVAGRKLPHWGQAGTISFLTWRTADSLPAAVLERMATERFEWLRVRGGSAERLSPQDAAAYQKFAQSRWNHALDSGLGACVLRDPARAAVVGDALHHFDGVRYVLFDFVIMPNHVHVLAAFPDDESMRGQCTLWKHFTARVLNRATAGRGRFWQEESFDHLCRSDEQFIALRGYIAKNPIKAGLRAGEYLHYSRDLTESEFHTVRTNPLAERAVNTREHTP